jgi:hypothetical protein
MYYLKIGKTSNTPVPFAELRCFTYLKEYPVPALYNAIKKTLEDRINDMIAGEESVFYSLYYAAIGDKTPVDTYDEMREEKIEANMRQVGPPIKGRVEIDGIEAEKVDMYNAKTIVNDEVVNLRLVKGQPNFIPLNKPIRYAAFLDRNGQIKVQYDEKDIQFFESKGE